MVEMTIKEEEEEEEEQEEEEQEERWQAKKRRETIFWAKEVKKFVKGLQGSPNDKNVGEKWFHKSRDTRQAWTGKEKENKKMMMMKKKKM